MENHKVVVVVAARSGSRRFPGKVLADFSGRSEMLNHVLARATNVGFPVVLTIPDDDPGFRRSVEPITALGHERIFEGPENDLVKRHLIASEGYDHVVRVTGDCPFLDPWAARCTIQTHLEGGYDLTTDHAEGRGVQVYKRVLLEHMDRILPPAPFPTREHLDIWPLDAKDSTTNVHHMKFSVDTPADLELARRRANL